MTARELEHATDEFWDYCEKFAIDGSKPILAGKDFKRLDEIAGEFAIQYHSSQMSGIAQRSAEKIYRSMNFDTTAGMINEWPSEEEIAAIIEQESERNGKQ
jgi:hypothetical protein